MQARVTKRDPKLAHQIRLNFKSGQGSITLVGCNCRTEPLGEMSTGSDPWPIYNDPQNHNQMRAPFAPGKSTAKVNDV